MSLLCRTSHSHFTCHTSAEGQLKTRQELEVSPCPTHQPKIRGSRWEYLTQEKHSTLGCVKHIVFLKSRKLKNWGALQENNNWHNYNKRMQPQEYIDSIFNSFLRLGQTLCYRITTMPKYSLCCISFSHIRFHLGRNFYYLIQKTKSFDLQLFDFIYFSCYILLILPYIF